LDSPENVIAPPFLPEGRKAGKIEVNTNGSVSACQRWVDTRRVAATVGVVDDDEWREQIERFRSQVIAELEELRKRFHGE
jgi:hypothetical protein